MSAEAMVLGGAEFPSTERAAGPFARGLAHLLSVTPAGITREMLEPSPPWTDIERKGSTFWPWPDDCEIDLNEIDGPKWLDQAALLARERLAKARGVSVVGHGDWYTGNLRWCNDALYVVHDWDSVIVGRETTIVGLGAAVYASSGMPMSEPTVEETAEFLASYQVARGAIFDVGELEECWAAGLWTRCFDAKKQFSVGVRTLGLTESEAAARLYRSGVKADL